MAARPSGLVHRGGPRITMSRAASLGRKSYIVGARRAGPKRSHVLTWLRRRSASWLGSTRCRPAVRARRIRSAARRARHPQRPRGAACDAEGWLARAWEGRGQCAMLCGHLLPGCACKVFVPFFFVCLRPPGGLSHRRAPPLPPTPPSLLSNHIWRATRATRASAALQAKAPPKKAFVCLTRAPRTAGPALAPLRARGARAPPIQPQRPSLAPDRAAVPYPSLGEARGRLGMMKEEVLRFSYRC